MRQRQQTQAATISRAIAAIGVSGVHVDIDEQDTVYLDGHVADADEEALAVQAALAAGAVAVVDGLTYPGQRPVTHHVAAQTSGIPTLHHKD
jgi:hypothetical protein